MRDRRRAIPKPGSVSAAAASSRNRVPSWRDFLPGVLALWQAGSSAGVIDSLFSAEPGRITWRCRN